MQRQEGQVSCRVSAAILLIKGKIQPTYHEWVEAKHSVQKGNAGNAETETRHRGEEQGEHTIQEEGENKPRK